MRLHALIAVMAVPAFLAATANQGCAQTLAEVGAQNGVQALLSVLARPNSSGATQTTSNKSGTSGGGRISLTPRYTAGQVIRYVFENTMTSEEHRGGAVSDPQGGGKLTVKWNAILRMEVLSVGKDAKGQPDGSVRIRSVYEKSAASTASDTYDPATDTMEAQLSALEGKMIEFSVDSEGKVTDIKGIEGEGGQANTDAMRNLLGQFSSGMGAPRRGVIVGESWTTDQPFEGAPLAGLVWKTHSTYLRNEPCQQANAEGDQNPTEGEMCAVILTKLDLTGSRPGVDATPESYRKQGMKTEGTWNATGDKLNYISLKDGQLVSFTQTSNEQMDFAVSSQDGGNRKLFQGVVQSRTQLALMPAGKK